MVGLTAKNSLRPHPRFPLGTGTGLAACIDALGPGINQFRQGHIDTVRVDLSR